MHGEHDPIPHRRPAPARRGRRPYDEPAKTTPGGPYGTADDPFAYGSWISVDIPPPHPPSPPRGRWPETPRDRLLRSALIVGFLASAGIGVWTSGWAPLSGRPTAGAVPAPAPSGYDVVITPTAGAPAATPGSPERRPHDRPPAGRPRPRPAPADAKSPGDRARGGAGTPRAGERPRTEEAAPDRRPRAEAPAPERARVPRAPRPHGVHPPSSTGASRPGTRPVRTGRPAATAAPPKTRGGRDGGDPAPRAGRRGTRHTAPPAPLPDGEARTPADTDLPAGIGERLGAAYACRHLRPDDWRYAYCVTAWNDYKRRVGLP